MRQFEREIIGERTRDKMSAARRKGKWVGGIPVLGYDVGPRGGRLIVNEREAVRVREIFRLYAKVRSLAPTVAELERRKSTTKSWTTKHGSLHAGSVFDKAMLLRFLTNAIYIGKVEHKGAIYAGEQAAIVEPELWEEDNFLTLEIFSGHIPRLRHVEHQYRAGSGWHVNLTVASTFTESLDHRRQPTKNVAGLRAPDNPVAARASSNRRWQ